MNHAEQERQVAGGFAAASVAVASVVALDPEGWFPFSIAKWPTVLACALIAVACVAWSERPIVGRWFATGWVVLSASVVLSALVGLDDGLAWFGTPVRHLGVATWLVFGALFVVGVSVGCSSEVVRGLTLAGGLLGAYTIWEVVGGRPVAFATNSSRLGGPYGSAAYLGAACCVLLPVAAGVALSSEASRLRRAASAAVAATLIVAAVGSGTRGALVALTFSAVIVVAIRHARPRNRLALFGGGAASIASCAAVAHWTGVTSRQSPVTSRLDEWGLGMTAWAERPWFGYGPEGYRLVVDRFLTRSYVLDYGDAVLPDRAHNAVLDVALSSGVFAAVAYVGLLVGVVAASVRVIRFGVSVQASLGAAAIAFVVQQQFLFPIAEIDAAFWIVAGAVVATARSVGAATLDVNAGNGAVLGLRVFSVGAVAAAIVVAVVGVRSVAADRWARSASTGSDIEVSVSDARRAVGLDTNDVRLPILLARSLERRQSLAGVDAAIAAVDTSRSISPLDPTVRRERARLATVRANITGSDTDRQRAVDLWRELVNNAPNCAFCRRELGLTLLEFGDEAAVVELGLAASLGDATALRVLEAGLGE